MRANVKGMTLLEIMLALAIFALAGVAVMKAAGENLRSLSILRETTYATIVANNRLAEIHLEKQWPPQNNKRGDEDMVEQKWYWKQVVKKTQDDKMREVTIEVSSDQGGKHLITSVSAFVSKANG